MKRSAPAPQHSPLAPPDISRATPALVQGNRRSVMFRALRSSNYRLFAGGQLVSLVGTWLTNVATSWLVFRLTRSTAAMGVVAFAGQLPAFLMSPLAGVLVDRWNHHRTLVVTQSLSAVQSAALAVLALGHWINVEWIVILQICQGLINALDMPTRQAFVVEVVDRAEDLPNAIALNSSIFNVARALGPAAAGLLIALVGEGYCFAIDAVSYIAVIIALLMMRLPRRRRSTEPANVLRALRQGVSHIVHSGPLSSIFTLLAIVSLTCIPFTTFLPAFAKLIGVSSRGFGIMAAAPGVGALAGAIYLASRRTVVGLGRLIPLAAAVFGASLMIFAYSRSLWLSLVILPFAGLGMILQMASSNTLLQVLADDDKRGRVMSIYVMLFMGLTPLGNLIGGILSERFGPSLIVAIGGAIGIAASIFFALRLPVLRRQIRPIYLQRGIIIAPAAPVPLTAEAAA